MPPSQYIVQFDRGDMQSMCIAQELGAKRSEIIEFSRMQCTPSSSLGNRRMLQLKTHINNREQYPKPMYIITAIVQKISLLYTHVV